MLCGLEQAAFLDSGAVEGTIARILEADCDAALGERLDNTRPPCWVMDGVTGAKPKHPHGCLLTTHVGR